MEYMYEYMQWEHQRKASKAEWSISLYDDIRRLFSLTPTTHGPKSGAIESTP